MADGPASKKRGALRQLTKDDDPDIDEDSAPTEAGTFKKASDDVMATRRILKVRRTPPPPAASNPFANIQLVTPSAPDPTPTPTPDGVPKVTSTTEEKALPAQAGPGADLLLEASIRAGETVVDDKAEEKANGNGKTGEAAKEAVENGDKEEHAAEVKSSERPSTMTFQQVSSSTNAFGSFGTGFSSSAFSFGATSSSLGTATSFSFGSSGSVPAFGSKPAEGFSSLFGNKDSSSSSPIPTSQQNQPAISLQEVPTETGEEKERAVFTGDATLYEFVEKSWKERGKGELKLNISEDVGQKARLVMRSKGNLRLLLNANLFPDMRLNKMDNRSVTFACANSAAGKNAVGLTTYAIKVKDSTAATDFMALVESHKGVKTEATAEVATTQDSAEKPEGSSSSQPADAGKESQPPPDTDTVSKDSQAASDAGKESQPDSDAGKESQPASDAGEES